MGRITLCIQWNGNSKTELLKQLKRLIFVVKFPYSKLTNVVVFRDPEVKGQGHKVTVLLSVPVCSRL